MQSKLISLIIAVLGLGMVYGTPHTALSCSQTHVQAAVNAAAAGVTARIPAGNYTWHAEAAITNKNITRKEANQIN